MVAWGGSGHRVLLWSLEVDSARHAMGRSADLLLPMAASDWERTVSLALSTVVGLPIPDIGRRARRAIAIGRKETWRVRHPSA